MFATQMAKVHDFRPNRFHLCAFVHGVLSGFFFLLLLHLPADVCISSRIKEKFNPFPIVYNS